MSLNAFPKEMSGMSISAYRKEISEAMIVTKIWNRFVSYIHGRYDAHSLIHWNYQYYLPELLKSVNIDG